MKYLKQFMLIIFISMIGEVLKYIIPLPFPASIYGMVILFICLLTGIIKLDDVQKTGKFMIEIMPVMFIPAGAGLISSWAVLKTMLFPVCIITIVTLITVMVTAGKTSQYIIRKENKKI